MKSNRVGDINQFPKNPQNFNSNRVVYEQKMMSGGFNPTIKNEALKLGMKRSIEELEANNNYENGTKKKIKIENIPNNAYAFPFPKKEKYILSKNCPQNALSEKVNEIFKEYPDELRINFEKTLKELAAEGFIVLYFIFLLLFFW